MRLLQTPSDCFRTVPGQYLFKKSVISDSVKIFFMSFSFLKW